MEEKRYCACGCGGELKVWKNGRISLFLVGHHMRKPNYKLPSSDIKHYCQCGCGTEILPNKSGFVAKYIWNHHLKNSRLSLEYRTERTRKRWKREPVISPYLEDAFVSFSNKTKRWYACIRENNKSKGVLHANAVYKNYFGEIPKGYVVHHKNGKHEKLTDDKPENLMLLLDEWNLRFFPTLAKGFGIPEEKVTDIYLSLPKDTKDMFIDLCKEIIKYKEQ